MAYVGLVLCWWGSSFLIDVIRYEYIGKQGLNLADNNQNKTSRWKFSVDDSSKFDWSAGQFRRWNAVGGHAQSVVAAEDRILK